MKRKVSPIFLLLFGEIIIIIILFFVKTHYVNMCEPYSLLNPLGLSSNKMYCRDVFYNMPHQNFYLMVDIFILTIVGNLIFKVIKYIKRKYAPNIKLSPIAAVILIESVITFVLGSIKLPCGSPCDPHSFLNPFGISDRVGQYCITVCAEDNPLPLFYLAFDITVITIVVYVVYRIIKAIRKGK
jgi:hypothetical protein